MAETTCYIRLNGDDRHRYECSEPFSIDGQSLVFTHEAPIITVRHMVTLESIDLIVDDEVVARVVLPFVICLNPRSNLKVSYTFRVVDQETRRRQKAYLN